MITELENFRQKYPQYSDMDDSALADRLASKYPDAYGDLPNKVKSIQVESNSKTSPGDNPKQIIQNALSFGPIGLSVGSEPKDIPGVAASVANGMLGFQPKAIEANPKEFAMAGIPGVNMAQGANAFTELQNILTGNSKSVPFPENENKFIPEPKTLSGKITGGILEMAAPMATEAYMNKAAKGISGIKAAKIAEKKNALTTELLQPSKQELASYLERGRQMPAVEQASKVIKKSQSYTELRQNLDDVISKTFEKRNQLLKEKNRKVGKSYLKELEDLIASESSKGQSKPEDILAMKRVLENEKNYLGISGGEEIRGGFTMGGASKQVSPQITRVKGAKVSDKVARPIWDPQRGEYVKNIETINKTVDTPNDIVALHDPGSLSPRKITSISPKETYSLRGNVSGGPDPKTNLRDFDLLDAQSRKEYLQDLTNRLLQRREGGEIVDLDPARNRALDALRRGLSKVINATDEKIAEINETYGGLLRAKELAAGQEALAQKSSSPNVLQKVIRGVIKTVSGRGANPSVTIMESAAARNKDVRNITGDIEKLQKILSRGAASR